MIITPKALNKLKEFRPSDNHFLRVSIVCGGCSGLSYHMEWKNNKENCSVYMMIDDGDNYFIVGTNHKTFDLIQELTLDYSDGLTGKGFEWANPGVKRVCGCGSSFSISE